MSQKQFMQTIYCDRISGTELRKEVVYLDGKTESFHKVGDDWIPFTPSTLQMRIEEAEVRLLKKLKEETATQDTKCNLLFNETQNYSLNAFMKEYANIQIFFACIFMTVFAVLACVKIVMGTPT